MDDLTFNDITDASAFAPEGEFPYLWVSLIAVALIVLIIYLLRRRPRVLEAIRVRPYGDALQSLSTQESTIVALSVPEAASALSLLIRGALTTASSSDCLFQTQQEFEHQQDSLHLASDHLTTLRHQLTTLWDLEYSAPRQDEPLVARQIEATRSLLTLLDRHSS